MAAQIGVGRKRDDLMYTPWAVDCKDNHKANKAGVKKNCSIGFPHIELYFSLLASIGFITAPILTALNFKKPQPKTWFI